MVVETEIIEKLQHLKGVNLDIVFQIFRQKKIESKYSGFVENLIAFLIDREFPREQLGMDFPGLFEVKEIKLKEYTRKGIKYNHTKSGKITTGGDTIISSYVSKETDFFESNIWDKSKNILIVLVDKDRNVVDVRLFDGEQHTDQMVKDYEIIKEHKNLRRSENEILVFKTGRNSIALKGNTAIEKSRSIFHESNDSVDHEAYISNLIDSKFVFYHRYKTPLEAVCAVIPKMSIADLKIIMKAVETKINEGIGFDPDSGSDLPF